LRDIWIKVWLKVSQSPLVDLHRGAQVWLGWFTARTTILIKVNHFGILFYFIFWILSIPVKPQTCYPPASASWVLELQVCATILSSIAKSFHATFRDQNHEIWW
jgi:hypothetical protein